MTSERGVGERRTKRGARSGRQAPKAQEVLPAAKPAPARAQRVIPREDGAVQPPRQGSLARGSPGGPSVSDGATAPELPSVGGAAYRPELPSASRPSPVFRPLASVDGLRKPVEVQLGPHDLAARPTRRGHEARAVAFPHALEAPGAREPLGPGNFFGERDELPAANLGDRHDNEAFVAVVRGWVLPEAAQGELERSLLPRAWQLLATRFSAAGERGPGDNRFVGVGESTFWAIDRAEAALSAIPRGRLAEQLTVELVQRTNAAIREVPVGSALVSNPGLRRQPVSRLAGPLSAEEVENVLALGLAVHRPVDGAGGAVRLAPAAPEKVPELLSALVGDTREALSLARSQADVVAVAERFARRLVALEPFSAANELTARILMDRILAERSLPPPILEGRVPRLTLSAAGARAELVQGIARTNARAQEALTSPEAYARELVETLGGTASGIPAPSPNRLVVRGVPYAQGGDGFIYDPSGRPFLLEPPGTLVRVNQLLHAFVLRRAWHSEKPVSALEDFTARSRERFATLVHQPNAGDRVQVSAEKKTIDAERAFRLDLPASGNEALLALYELDTTLTPERAFDPSDPNERRPSAIFTSARYQQLDLELWHVEEALRRNGDASGAARMRKQRESLFARAKEHFDRQRRSRDGAPSVTAGHLGEQLALTGSPLLSRTLREAESAVGGDTIRAYRSMTAAEVLLGADPDQHAGRADALTTWSRIAAAGAGPVIPHELRRVEDPREEGTGFVPLTSDASRAASLPLRSGRPVTVEVRALPGRLAPLVARALDRASPIRGEQPLSVAWLQRLVDPSRPEAPPSGSVDVMTLTPSAFERAARTALGASAAALLVAEFRRLRGRIERSVSERLATAIESGPRYLDVRAHFEGGEGRALERERAFLEDLRRSADELRGAVLADGRVRIDPEPLVAEVALPRASTFPGLGSLGGKAGEVDQLLASAKRVAPQQVLSTHRLPSR